MSKEQEKGRQRHSGLLKWVIYQQGAGEMDTYKRDRLEGEGERKDRMKRGVDIKID